MLLIFIKIGIWHYSPSTAYINIVTHWFEKHTSLNSSPYIVQTLAPSPSLGVTILLTQHSCTCFLRTEDSPLYSQTHKVHNLTSIVNKS